MGLKGVGSGWDGYGLMDPFVISDLYQGSL